MKKPIGTLIVLIGLPAAGFQAGIQTPEPNVYEGSGGIFSGMKGRYLPRPSPPVDYANSARLDKLMRAGRIYLSLQDAIALALENNLDIEFARYGPRVADTDVQRASAGQLLRNLGGTNIRSGPRSATGALAGVSGVSAGGGTGGTSQGGILSGVSVQLAGSAIPNLDPQAFFQGQFGHSTQIITNSFATGTNYLVSGYKATGYGITKGFLTGTSVRLDMSSQNLSQNSPRNDFNPATSGNLGFSINQHLLQGFGLALNSRVIKIAKNNRHAADLSFKSQVIATVTNMADLYWDLVTYNENLRVRQQALELNPRLYTDNKRRAELGAIAPIDIVQAEAEVAASQQEVTNAETQVLQQEMILKSVLTRSGAGRYGDHERAHRAHGQDSRAGGGAGRAGAGPGGGGAGQPAGDRAEPHLARKQPPEHAGHQERLMPTLDVFASMQNNALAGQVNTVTLETGAAQQAIIAQRAASLNPFFLGGYGTFMSQLLRRNFPDYAIGFSFSVPLSNRSAQADYIKDQLNYRQQQINDRQMNNNIRLNVINARTALMQARAAYDTSVKARMLQEQTLNGERRKFHLGTSSFLNVVIVQRDAVARQAAEVAALNNYIRARNNLQAVVGPHSEGIQRLDGRGLLGHREARAGYRDSGTERQVDALNRGCSAARHNLKVVPTSGRDFLRLRVRAERFVRAAAVNGRHAGVHGAQVRAQLPPVMHAVDVPEIQVHHRRQIIHAEKAHLFRQLLAGHPLHALEHRRDARPVGGDNAGHRRGRGIIPLRGELAVYDPFAEPRLARYNVPHQFARGLPLVPQLEVELPFGHRRQHPLGSRRFILQHLHEHRGQAPGHFGVQHALPPGSSYQTPVERGKGFELTVLYLEGESFSSYRLLRCVKNRFGPTNEVGIFEMKEQGMVEVANPSEVFLSHRSHGAVGSVVTSTLEGTRPLLVEMQALTSVTSFGLPRRTANGVDLNRLLLIIAVLSRRAGLRLSNQDIIVNAVGGLKTGEPAAGLGGGPGHSLQLQGQGGGPGHGGDRGTGTERRSQRCPADGTPDRRCRETGFHPMPGPGGVAERPECATGIEVVPVETLGDALQAASIVDLKKKIVPQ